MRPILEIEPATARGLLGLVFDVDDTLTRGGKLEAAAFQALWQLRNAGLALIAVTGRPLGFAELMARQWPLDAAVGENGAGYIRVTEDALLYGYYAPEAERAAHRALLEKVRARVARDAPFAQLTDDSWARRCDLAWDVAERQQLTAAQIAQLCALIEAEGAHCLVSSVHAHAALGECDKARGAIQAAAALGHDIAAEPARWLFVGDSGNDAAAFSYFPLSAGVANVREHLAQLQVLPRYVSRADRGAGFAEIAEVVTGRR
jgi:HAD superfamily hydrolase (TIGR01484 family)